MNTTVHQIDPSTINEQKVFLANLADRPVAIDGIFPHSFDKDTRTDIAVAMLRSGLIRTQGHCQDSYARSFSICIPFILQGLLYAPEGVEFSGKRNFEIQRTIRFTWINEDRLQQAIREMKQ